MYQAIDIGAQIRYFRQLRGRSQENLALHAGINPAFLGHLERGLKSPTVTMLEKVAAALDITLEELFTDKLPPNELPVGEPQVQLDRILFLLRDLNETELIKVAEKSRTSYRILLN